MKILLITEFFPTGKDLRFSGGVEARTFFVAKHLAKRHSITVITSRVKGSAKNERMFGFKILRVGKVREYASTGGSLIGRIRFIQDAISIGKKQPADIVEGTNFVSHFISKQIASYQKIPVIFWYPDVWIGSWVQNIGIIGIFGEILERVNLILGAGAYIVISKQTENKLKKFVKNKISVIYCGIDENEFKVKAQKFRVPTIISVSRLAKYKNIKTLILAFAYLTTRIKKLNLIIVGTGPQKDSLIKLTKTLNLEGKVKFYSYLPRRKLIKLYKSSHIFSLPSQVEGFGIATIEAAVSGLPYVNSNIEIQREVTQNSKGGFLVNLNEPLIFAEKIQDLLTDKYLYQNKASEANTLAKSYNWERIARQTEAVWRSVK